MPTINEQKEHETPATPLLLFDCVLRTGAVERWCTHRVRVGEVEYQARVLDQNLFALQASSEEGLDAVQKVSVELANADSYFSQLERSTGLKGAQITVAIVFYDLASDAPVSETRVLFRGVADSPEEITEASLRLSLVNRLNLQRVVLPDVRIERRCPWTFPSDALQRHESLDGGARGKYSALYRCGYSPDQTNGVGTLNGEIPFATCDYTRASCEARGMFDADANGRSTRRFGGIEFVPAVIGVRGFGEKASHLSTTLENQSRYNDYVPLVYGTAWYRPPIVFARNDGNLTRMEVLLGVGKIEDVVKVVVNDVEVPEGQTGADMTATGWYHVVTPGTRNGGFNLNFADASGRPLGDPYGNMALLSVVIPNQISSGQSLARVEVLLKGLRLERFDENGVSLGETFTNNPAWVLLDVLRCSGWTTQEIDLPRFAAAAEYCGTLVSTTDLYGNPTAVPRYQCNVVIQARRSAADVTRGIRNGSMLMLGYGSNGLLTLRAEGAIAMQQPSTPAGSNSIQPINGGWPAYEFSEGSAAFSGILRRPHGEASIRLWSRSGGDRPNRLTVEFQDEFNEYQQDSLALVDIDDAQLMSREVTAIFPALGIANFDQATRVLSLQLAKNVRGATFVEFETSVRGLSLKPGDLIAVTYAKEGLQRQLFRVVKLAPTRNYETIRLLAQWHDDSWYEGGSLGVGGGRRQSSAGIGLPRPLVGSSFDANGDVQFEVVETAIQNAEGSAMVDLEVSFSSPASPEISGASIPLISLNPVISLVGGVLRGDQTYYYGVTAVDVHGKESPLSFVVRAKIPSTTSASVELTGLSFSPDTQSFCVYRGTNPNQLFQIAAGVAVATIFTDSGGASTVLVPPDQNYDHANFYWRWELQPEAAADVTSQNTIGNSGLGMSPNEFVGSTVRINRGVGAGQERRVTANDGTTLTVIPVWNVVPDASSSFSVAESTWNFGALGKGSPIHIQVPNRSGASIQISGRSANVHDQESLLELNPLTSWQIGVGGGITSGPAPLPSYVLSAGGQGTVELTQVAFPHLTNTSSITAGTLTLFYWNELNGPTRDALVNAISTSDAYIQLGPLSNPKENDFLQINSELMQVTAVQADGIVEVQRAMHESTAESHLAATPVYILRRSDIVAPFVRDLFGSPTSANYVHSVFLPNARIAAAEFFVNNSWGMSPVRHYCYTELGDGGIRTLAGGQISIQVEGYLAVETDAAPPFVLEDTHVPRDITAVLREDPVSGTVEMRLRLGEVPYCMLTFDDGSLISNTVNGFGLPPLAAGSELSLDILSVPTASGSRPGRSLTVTIRL